LFFDFENWRGRDIIFLDHEQPQAQAIQFQPCSGHHKALISKHIIEKEDGRPYPQSASAILLVATRRIKFCAIDYAKEKTPFTRLPYSRTY
jgi:hypothetical protein